MNTIMKPYLILYHDRHGRHPCTYVISRPNIWDEPTIPIYKNKEVIDNKMGDFLVELVGDACHQGWISCAALRIVRITTSTPDDRQRGNGREDLDVGCGRPRLRNRKNAKNWEVYTINCSEGNADNKITGASPRRAETSYVSRFGGTWFLSVTTDADYRCGRGENYLEYQDRGALRCGPPNLSLFWLLDATMDADMPELGCQRNRFPPKLVF